MNDQPNTPPPSDAELIEHARAAGWHEPEKAPEFLAAYRAHVEERSAADGAQPCGSVRDVLPCILAQDHDGLAHQDVNGYKWPTATALRQAAEDLRPAGLDALLGYVAANLPDEPCAHESWDVTGEHRTDAGWVKSRKCNGCSASLDPVTEAEPHWDFQPAELAQGQADADALAAEFPDTAESLLAELVDDLAHLRRAPAIAADYLARHRAIVFAVVADVVEALPQDHELDPGRGDVVVMLRAAATLAAAVANPAEQPPAERPLDDTVRCAHDYGLMRDSCPGCDAEQETPHAADPVTVRPSWAKRDMRRCRRCSLTPSHRIHRAPRGDQ
jgi:hypothetical protein